MTLYVFELLNLQNNSKFQPSSSLRLSDSRQRYVLGDSAMQQMAQSTVFLSGLNGVGVEIGRIFRLFPSSRVLCVWKIAHFVYLTCS